MKTVDLGHRGLGADTARSEGGRTPIISENTILSFVTAGQFGRESVEFDVQLTSDNVPVIYHDFVIPVCKNIKMPVTQMTLKEFKKVGRQQLSPYNSPYENRERKKKGEEKTSSKHSESETDLPKMKRSRSMLDIPEPQRPSRLTDMYPTLREVFLMVPDQVGFDIEVKYPSAEELTHSLVTFPERNHVVDVILQVVFDYASKSRNIVWSSFDPDICTMLSLKQPRYPVFYLTTGKAKYIDQRRNSLHAAIKFAKSVDLLGIISNAEPIIMAPQIVKVIKNAGLLLGTYGSANNQKEKVEMQVEWGVDAIISDHMM
eukprot:CAMPEP_0174277610 /NCGR_PEP_ID=MMETSP0439-20130205/61024_1 /TAXON_ID=0 /ORGANISM="Stereomyxa ramosa, Strain Chinc5" /LENGTH=315 /DNA_ID=CAMNT_0015369947 /DNA_START=2440 /DNA_END=3387 /DNA_ORIENTATION=+